MRSYDDDRFHAPLLDTVLMQRIITIFRLKIGTQLQQNFKVYMCFHHTFFIFNVTEYLLIFLHYIGMLQRTFVVRNSQQWDSCTEKVTMKRTQNWPEELALSKEFIDSYSFWIGKTHALLFNHFIYQFKNHKKSRN